MEKIDKNIPIRIVYEYPDRIETIVGTEAKKLNETIIGLCGFAQVHSCNPFDRYKPKWKVKKK
ncbi:MAG: hypothetical protein KAX49_13785 [Halanaerobiales bacterium]|nr:hypothetical protein [Halanaerobiales bacterium]